MIKLRRYNVLALVTLIGLLLGACRGAFPTPVPARTPTPIPTATPSPMPRPTLPPYTPPPSGAVSPVVIQRAPERGEELRPDGSIDIRAMNITYVVSFDDAQTFARHVYMEAARRGLHHAQEVVVLGDGAEWIWNRIARFCNRPVEIVDFYHGTEHVWNAGQALYGEGTEETEQWVTQRLEELLEQGPEALLTSLWTARAEASAAVESILGREINYFSKHKQRMRYPQLRAAGYHIGSGSVESACKRIIGARLKQAGMIWTREGAEAVAHLRATILCDRWDAFWTSYDRTTRTVRLAA